MFDNLFGFAGPLGTAIVLFGILAGAIATFSIAGRLPQTPGRRARV
jgi:uncharacterized membrane protein YdjX (TVP38/TMEM64 family)